ncbi:uncharacterized protein [Miscanthus floridulus]|uniref:uncharacterized protein n=1 Tax=Miscanthus floridulus TaxID=154761 RepID=UPI003458607F
MYRFVPGVEDVVRFLLSSVGLFSATVSRSASKLGAVRPAALAVAAGRDSALSTVPLIRGVLASHASPRWQDIAVCAQLRRRHHHLHQLRRERVDVVAVAARHRLLVGVDVRGSLLLQARQLRLKPASIRSMSWRP